MSQGEAQRDITHTEYFNPTAYAEVQVGTAPTVTYNQESGQGIAATSSSDEDDDIVPHRNRKRSPSSARKGETKTARFDEQSDDDVIFVGKKQSNFYDPLPPPLPHAAATEPGGADPALVGGAKPNRQHSAGSDVDMEESPIMDQSTFLGEGSFHKVFSGAHGYVNREMRMSLKTDKEKLEDRKGEYSMQTKIKTRVTELLTFLKRHLRFKDLFIDFTTYNANYVMRMEKGTEILTQDKHFSLRRDTFVTRAGAFVTLCENVFFSNLLEFVAFEDLKPENIIFVPTQNLAKFGDVDSCIVLDPEGKMSHIELQRFLRVDTSSYYPVKWEMPDDVERKLEFISIDGARQFAKLATFVGFFCTCIDIVTNEPASDKSVFVDPDTQTYLKQLLEYVSGMKSRYTAKDAKFYAGNGTRLQIYKAMLDAFARGAQETELARRMEKLLNYYMACINLTWQSGHLKFIRADLRSAFADLPSSFADLSI